MGKEYEKFKHVFEIKRTSPLDFTVIRAHYDTMHSFETPQECLTNFLKMKKRFKEAMRFGEFK